MTTNRTSKGVPEGGEFAAHTRDESSVTLTSPKFRQTAQPKRSPWGEVQYGTELANGIWTVGTAGHGGYKLSSERNALVNEAWRASDGWYEEDVDFVIPCLTFPDELGGDDEKYGLDYFNRVARDYRPDQWEKVTGLTILPGESYQRDRDLFEEATKTKHVTVAAISRDDGQTRVWTRLRATGETASVILPPGLYRTRGDNNGLIINPDDFLTTSDLAEELLGQQQRCLDLKSPDSNTGEFLTAAGAAPHLARVTAEYNAEMAHLNPGRWGIPEWADNPNWSPLPMVDTKTKRALFETRRAAEESSK